MEAAGLSETLIPIYQTTRRDNTETRNSNIYRSQNFKYRYLENNAQHRVLRKRWVLLLSIQCPHRRPTYFDIRVHSTDR